MVTDLDTDAARALTDEIRADAEMLWDKIVTAYTRRAWIALGYETWDVYCIKEFGSSRLRLPREERPEMVASLRQSGLSIRAIASVTGASHTHGPRRTSLRDEVYQTGTPGGRRGDRRRGGPRAEADHRRSTARRTSRGASVLPAIRRPCCRSRRSGCGTGSGAHAD